MTPGQLCCNTPSDFDFKLPAEGRLSVSEFIQHVRQTDVVFSVIHGEFGEDGEFFSLLEDADVPFVGSCAQVSACMFDKSGMRAFLKKHEYDVRCRFIACEDGDAALEEKIKAFWQECVEDKAVVKPNYGGSSIGVDMVVSPEDALAKVRALHENGSSVALLEVFMRGREFSVIVMQDHATQAPVSLIPTEIVISTGTDEIFSYRRKYLPTFNTRWRCPSFDAAINERIRRDSENIFRQLGCRDFVRMDGWVCGEDIVWTDFNPISGLEQNSFLFLQGARVGMSHQHVLRYIIQNALLRCNKKFSLPVELKWAQLEKKVFVLCGGDTAERQVSLMSGLNVFLQLLNARSYNLTLFVCDGKSVWRVPYALGLFHTVEEVCEECLHGESTIERLKPYKEDVRTRLNLCVHEEDIIFVPTRCSLESFIDNAVHEKAFVFLGLHGGWGENGEVQKLLEKKGCSFNGSSSQVCALLMDKKRTGDAVNNADISGVFALNKVLVDVRKATSYMWEDIVNDLGAMCVVAKPNTDGCSAGVIVLRSQRDLAVYLEVMSAGRDSIPANTFYGQCEEVVCPKEVREVIFEPFIECDAFCISGHSIKHVKKEGWVELTVGIIEKSGTLYALNPSMTLAEGVVLSLEEKFQGGTGVNITPPPDFVMDVEQVESIRARVCDIAQVLGVQGYARVDLFYNLCSQRICIIEFNALPGLTASTVFYHQGISEIPPIYPRNLLQKLLA